MAGKQPGLVSSRIGELLEFLVLSFQCAQLVKADDLHVFRPYGMPVPYRKFQERFATILASHHGRPHWAKQHTLKPKDVEALYPKFDDYRRVLQRIDPEGILRSEYVKRHIDGEDVDERVFKKRQFKGAK